MMALWEINSPELASSPFEDVAPVEILSQFDVPLTFTFHDGLGVLCLAHLCAVGKGLSRYLVSKTNSTIVSDLKTGMISIRSALRMPLWLVDVSAKWKVVHVWRTDPQTLPPGAIPDSDVLLTEELEEAQRGDEKLARFARSGSDGHIAFDGKPVQDYKIDAGFYGSFFQSATELFREICSLLEIPTPVLRIGMSSRSSYAVDLTVSEEEKAAPEYQMFQEVSPPPSPDADRQRQAFDYLMSMLAERKPPETTARLIRRSQKIRQRYGNVLELVSHNSATVSVRTRSNPSIRSLSGMQASEQLSVVRQLGYPFMFLVIRGRLIGGLIEKAGNRNREFDIVVEEEGRKPEFFRGAVADEVIPKLQLLALGNTVEAKLKIQEDDRQQTYTLVDINHLEPSARHSIT